MALDTYVSSPQSMRQIFLFSIVQCCISPYLAHLAALPLLFPLVLLCIIRTDSRLMEPCYTAAFIHQLLTCFFFSGSRISGTAQPAGQ